MLAPCILPSPSLRLTIGDEKLLERGMYLGKMERSLTLLDGDVEPFAQDLDVAVVWHLEIVDACHDRRKVIVGGIWWLAGLAHDGKHGCESFKTFGLVSETARIEEHIMPYLQLEVWDCQ